ERISHEAQKQAHDCDSRGSSRTPRRHGRLRAGQVLAAIAERNRVLRLQGIRGLGGGLFRPDRRSAQGDRRQSDHDRGVQGRRCGQRAAFPGWLQDREAPVEAEEEHGGPIRRGCARRLHAGFRHRKGQQEISEKRRMGIRAVQLRSRIRQVHGRSQPLRLRTRVPCGREGEGPHLPPVPEALNRAKALHAGYFCLVSMTLNIFELGLPPGVKSDLTEASPMLKLPPPVWALVYVLFAVAISWPLAWPKMPGFPLPPLGIALVTISWTLPVWAIIMFRREGTEVSPTSPANRRLTPANRRLITIGPY